MNVPLIDISAQYESSMSEIIDDIRGIIQSGKFIMGPQVKELETQMAKYLGVKHCIGVSSGTDALILSLIAAGVKEGDEVITTPFTFFATAEAIVRVGAVPVFVDIDPNTFNIEPTNIEAAITNNTTAIIPVHLFGQSCDMTKTMEIAIDHDLLVIEDCAQAMGAEWMKDKVGSFGDTGCFSFFPSKNLGCMGDGGMIATDDDEIHDTIKKLRVHGSSKPHHHDTIGGNFRLDTIQAAIILRNYRTLDKNNSLRMANSAAYDSYLSRYVTLPEQDSRAKHVYNQYTIRIKDGKRDQMADYLTKKGIGNAIYYPIPLHKQTAFKDNKYPDLPEADRAAKEVISIPIYPQLTNNQIDYILETIKGFQ